ncbi:hypothetical protein EVB91_072 [Rhizobium phage RHph_I1_18]|nr:hypothetical protein EVB91_072 [Rhizobium phage RHph_I1_18]
MKSFKEFMEAVIPFKKHEKKKTLLDRSDDLVKAIRGPYGAAVAKQKADRAAAETARQNKSEFGHMSDRELVHHYRDKAKKKGDKWHSSNAREHEDVLDDGGIFDRDATIHAIRSLDK